jgi:hypothetical protein
MVEAERMVVIPATIITVAVAVVALKNPHSV